MFGGGLRILPQLSIIVPIIRKGRPPMREQFYGRLIQVGCPIILRRCCSPRRVRDPFLFNLPSDIGSLGALHWFGFNVSLLFVSILDALPPLMSSTGFFLLAFVSRWLPNVFRWFTPP